MSGHTKRDALLAFLQQVMDVGVEVVAQCRLEIGEKWARDPKVIALTLLCRTLGNLKAAVLLLENRLLVEGQILTRCCVENLICIGAVAKSKDAFVEELLSADISSKRKQLNIVKKRNAKDAEGIQSAARIDKILARLNEQNPGSKLFNLKNLANENPVGDIYLQFSVLSERAAHVTASSLGQHLSHDTDNQKKFLRIEIAPTPSEDQIDSALFELAGVVFGVVVGTNEIIGGTEPGLKLNKLLIEFEAIRNS